jgi:PAS domain S-box-containing protein
MKKKVLSATLAFFWMTFPAFAQQGLYFDVARFSVPAWINMLSGLSIGVSLILIQVIMWRRFSGIRQWESFKPWVIFGMAVAILLGTIFLIDAFRSVRPTHWLTITLRVVAAFALVGAVGVVISKRKRITSLDASENFETLVERRTSELSALNQQLQLEVESRKVAEKEVAKREKRFRALIENIGDGIVVNDEDSAVLYQSPSVTRILGYTFEDRHRKPVLNYVHPEDKESFLKFYEELAVQPGKPLPFQIRVKHKNGHYVWLEGVVTNLLHDRNVNGYVANYRDISERKTAEESLRQERYLLRTLIDHVPDYIYIKDTDLRHIINNKANVELIGAASEEETIGKTVLDYFAAELAAQFMEADRKVLASGQAVLNLEESIIGHSTEVRWLLTSKIPLIENGEVVGLIGISRDITELKKAELVLRDLNDSLSHQAERLEASNAELERFAYIASHDLQEPLRTVRSFLQLLKKRTENQLDQESQQYIDVALEGAERMKLLISDLLEYAHVDAVLERREMVDMSEVVRRKIEMMRESVISSGAEFKIGPLPAIAAVRSQMESLTQNLISNAIKYRGNAAPNITIEGIEQPAHWKFSVSDTGIGIDPRFHDKIFVIFQRANTEGEAKGTGIGLAICKKIVEFHGGKIWVESRPEAGSTFHFTIAKTNHQP